jgi:hypothetical protein
MKRWWRCLESCVDFLLLRVLLEPARALPYTCGNCKIFGDGVVTERNKFKLSSSEFKSRGAMNQPHYSPNLFELGILAYSPSTTSNEHAQKNNWSKQWAISQQKGTNVWHLSGWISTNISGLVISSSCVVVIVEEPFDGEVQSYEWSTVSKTWLNGVRVKWPNLLQRV